MRVFFAMVVYHCRVQRRTRDNQCDSIVSSGCVLRYNDPAMLTWQTKERISTQVDTSSASDATRKIAHTNGINYKRYSTRKLQVLVKFILPVRFSNDVVGLIGNLRNQRHENHSTSTHWHRNGHWMPFDLVSASNTRLFLIENVLGVL